MSPFLYLLHVNEKPVPPALKGLQIPEQSYVINGSGLDILYTSIVLLTVYNHWDIGC